MPVSIADLTAAYLRDKDALERAQAAERDARRTLHVSSTAVASRVEEDGKDQIGKEFVWQTNERSAPELCQIVGVRCHPYSAAELHPVVITKTKAGTWGKTRTVLNRQVFDHETRQWVQK